MADDIVLNAGVGGDTVAADDIGGIKHQRVKIEWGPNNTVNEVDNAAGKALPIKISETGSFLPAALGSNGGLKIENVDTVGLITLQAAQVSGTAVTTTTRTTTTGLSNFSQAVILINITAGGAAGGTLQLFLEDSADGGTTWDDLVSSNTFVFGAAVTTQMFCLNGGLATSKTQGSALQQETLAAGTARSGPWGDRIRVREKVTVGGGTGATYTITAVFKR